MEMDKASSDPLSLLRHFNMEKREIVEEGEYIIFGKYYWPKTVYTNYYKRGVNDDVKEYYTLECLMNFLRNVNLPHPAYVRQADAKGIAAVRRPDRKDLLKYLNGEISSSTNIDTKVAVKPAQVMEEGGPPTGADAPHGTDGATVISGANKHKSEEQTTETGVKKQKVDHNEKECSKEKELEQ